MNKLYLIGIDEVGRGPLAGPAVLGAVCIPIKSNDLTKKSSIKKLKTSTTIPYLQKKFAGVKDSKQLSHEQRVAWLKIIKEEQMLGKLQFSYSSISHSRIDGLGLTKAIKIAVARTIFKLGKNADQCIVLLDGLLKAPKIFKKQYTIIGGDEKEPLIALASIVAKVARDARMTRLAKIYPDYNFQVHKGYATAEHIQKLMKIGPCPIHRRKFIKNFV